MRRSGVHCPTTFAYPKKSDDSQRHKIFWTQCTIRNIVCNVIIDSGNSENVVSKALVKALNLKTDKHPSP